jgi:O6-methylguanine-DNA--protein-cysteine methyltransferase
MIRTVIIGTPLGEMKAAATREGICFLSFNNENKNPESLEKLSKTLGLSVKKGSNKHLRMLGKQLKDYFKGKRKEFLSFINNAWY